MKTKLLVLIIISFLLSSISCKYEVDCLGDIDKIIIGENIYINILDNQSENVFINGFSIDSLKIFENNQELSYEESNNIIKFKLSDDFYKHTENISGDEIITYLYLQLAHNTVDTITIKTIPRNYPDECNRTSYFNTRIYYNSNSIIENMNGPMLFYSTHGKSLTLSRQ